MGVDGASKTYAPNRLRSCLHLLALPPAVLNSLCVVMRQLGAGDAAGDAAASVVTARVVLVPAYLLEASQGKDQLGRYVCIACVCRMCVCVSYVCVWWRPSMPPIRPHTSVDAPRPHTTIYVSHTTTYLCRVLLNRRRPSMPPISVKPVPPVLMLLYMCLTLLHTCVAYY